MERFFSLSVQLTSKGKRVVRNHNGAQPRNYKQNANKWNYKRSKALHFKIVIPNGQSCDQKWLLTSIVNECGIHFRVFQYHYERNSVLFFVDSFPIARLLCQASGKIQGEHQHKFVIKVFPCHLSRGQTAHMQYMDTSELTRLIPPKCIDQCVDHIQNCLQKRYNQTLESLDLSNLASDPALLSANIYVSFCNLPMMELIMQIIAHHFPQLMCLNLSHNWLSRLSCFAHLFYAAPHLKFLDLSYNCLYKTQDLDIIRNLELIELCLQGNPLYKNENFSILCRLITYHFPTLQKLDGRFVTHSFFLEPEEPHLLPPAKGSFFLNDHIKCLIEDFLPKFFKMYDSGLRQGLLALYHEHCCCSLSIHPVLCQHPWFEQIMDYCKENRNLRKVKKAGLRQQLIKYNRLQVVGFLCNLPETEHDLQSLTVDVSLPTASLICFSIAGRFKEVQKKRDIFISFRRTFIIVPAADFGAQITNDQMFINDLFMSLPDVAFPKHFKSTPSCEDLATVVHKQSKLSLYDDPVTIERLPVTIDHMPVTIDHRHSKLNLCDDPVTIDRLPVTIDHLPVTIDRSHTKLNLCDDPVTIDRLPVTIDRRHSKLNLCDDHMTIDHKHSKLNLCDDPVTIDRLPVTIDHRHSKLNLCDDPVTIDHLPVPIDRLPMTIDHLPVTIDHLPVTIDHLPMTIDHLPVTIDHRHSKLNLREEPAPVEHNTVLHFAKCTGMKPDWALKCLTDNKWNTEESFQIFQLLKAHGTIPAEAFQEEEPPNVIYV